MIPGFKNDLTESLRAAEADPQGIPVGTRFFQTWLARPRQSYFFLFRKNFRVTNIQYAELLALFRSFAYYPIDSDEENNAERVPAGDDLTFTTVSAYKRTIQSLMDDFGPANDIHRIDRLVDLYSRLLYRTVALDYFYGSCCLFVPRHIDVDLASICAFSGYIHSCGYNIFTRNAQKASHALFADKLTEHLDSTAVSKRVRFAVYSHEDYTPYDEHFRDELTNGIDDVKIHVEKFYMSGERLVSVLRGLQKSLSDRLVVIPPGDYREGIKKLQQQASRIDQERTIWLLADRRVDRTTVQSGTEVRPPHSHAEPYLVCYDQLYLNANQFQLFDENKPAWVAHTTLPHSLAAAMINITRPEWRRKGGTKFADPFVGTGTTMMEALKDERINFHAADREPIANLLIGDNLKFMSASGSQLDDWCAQLKEICNWLDGSAERGAPAKTEIERGVRARYARVTNLVTENQIRPGADSVVLEPLHDELLRFSEADRLFFYVWLRTLIRRAPSIERKRESYDSAFRREALTLCEQFKRLKESVAERAKLDGVCAGIAIISSWYSRATCIDPEWLRGCYLNMNGKFCEQRDASEIEEDRFDVIITDPPYGFNTNERAEELAKVYDSSLQSMIGALREGGQLVVCLLDRSFTGRQAHMFTHPRFVVNQVLAACRKKGRRIVSFGSIVPRPRALFDAPYYWESEKALRRNILHFHVYKQ